MTNTPSALCGIWRLVSYDVEVQDTGERFPGMGATPAGYVMFSPQGRVWFMLTAADRPVPVVPEDRIMLLDSMIAYSGKYWVDGQDWVTDVDVAWNPSWVGTQQRRHFQRDGNRLQVMTPWRVMPNWGAHGHSRSIIEFEREDG